MKLQTLEVQGLIYLDSEMSRNGADGRQSRLNGQWRWKTELLEADNKNRRQGKLFRTASLGSTTSDQGLRRLFFRLFLFREDTDSPGHWDVSRCYELRDGHNWAVDVYGNSHIEQNIQRDERIEE